MLPIKATPSSHFVQPDRPVVHENSMLEPRCSRQELRRIIRSKMVQVTAEFNRLLLPQLSQQQRLPGRLSFLTIRDEVAGVEDTRDLWRGGRSEDAPWTLAIQPEAPHGSPDFLERAKNLLIPWVVAVVEVRTSPGSTTLRSVSGGAGWLVNHETSEAAVNEDFSGSASDASWLPDEPSVRAWRTVTRAR